MATSELHIELGCILVSGEVLGVSFLGSATLKGDVFSVCVCLVLIVSFSENIKEDSKLTCVSTVGKEDW